MPFLSCQRSFHRWLQSLLIFFHSRTYFPCIHEGRFTAQGISGGSLPVFNHVELPRAAPRTAGGGPAVRAPSFPTSQGWLVVSFQQLGDRCLGGTTSALSCFGFAWLLESVGVRPPPHGRFAAPTSQAPLPFPSSPRDTRRPLVLCPGPRGPSLPPIDFLLCSGCLTSGGLSSVRFIDSSVVSILPVSPSSEF